jgi:sulfate transport system ATP-binding protein
VRKRFDAFRRLRGVSLDIQPGELVALLGPSGSGKTTLLRLIAGLEQADRGPRAVRRRGRATSRCATGAIGFVFQQYALFRHMTVAENIAFGLKVAPAQRAPDQGRDPPRVGELLELVQLPGLEKRYPSQLSGGQRQRVALARALAIEPRVLLLDEPFGALDAKVRKDLRRWLRDLHDRTGHTTVFVTHDQEEALELADRVVILNDGRIEQVGTADDVYDHPATPFVCEFLGEVNKLPVKVAMAALPALWPQAGALPAPAVSNWKSAVAASASRSSSPSATPLPRKAGWRSGRSAGRCFRNLSRAE